MAELHSRAGGSAHKLTAMAVRNLRQPGKYGDGKGLWLVVSTPERRAWVLRFMLRGKAREMSLGSADAVGLAEARTKAEDARRLLARASTRSSSARPSGQRPPSPPPR